MKQLKPASPVAGPAPDRPPDRLRTGPRTGSGPVPGLGLARPGPGLVIKNLIFFIFCRESDIQWVDTHNIFHTPGIIYRPANLKTMTALLGNSETRQVYKNFQIENLNSDNLDISHHHYQKYLQYNFFIPPREKKYFSHSMFNTIPATPATDTGKGLFNIFPLDLTADEIKKTSTNLGNSSYHEILSIKI